MRRPSSPKKTPPKTKVSKAPPALKGVVVVIDPGHGGNDSGAISHGVFEAALTYRMATTLAEVLKPLGAEVQFTVRSAALKRKPIEPPPLLPVKKPEVAQKPPLKSKPEPPLLLPRDAALVGGHHLDSGGEIPDELHGRAGIAAKAWEKKAPHVVFISLHFDVSEDPGDHGGFTMWDIRGDHPPTLAREITRRFGAAGLSGNRRSRPRPNDLGVTNPEFNPVPQKTLVELATITNANDRKNALDPRWRWRVARILAASIIACKKAKVI
jgi:N-acetylmuramoyl-L-alanine amidase